MAKRFILRTQSDERLVELSRCGHGAAFEEIVRRYREPIGRYCGRLAGCAQAEEAAQQTFVSAWAALGRGGEVRDLRPWLYRIAQRESLRSVTAGRDMPLPLELAADAGADDADARLAMRHTLAALAGLPDRQRTALTMVAGGYNPDEVAHALGMSAGAARQLVCRARAALRAAASTVTPWPIAVRLASAAGTAPELVGGVGSAGVTAFVLKAIAVVGIGGAALGVGKVVVERAGASPPERPASAALPAAGRETLAERLSAPVAVVAAVARLSAERRGPGGSSTGYGAQSGSGGGPQHGAGTSGRAFPGGSPSGDGTNSGAGDSQPADPSADGASNADGSAAQNDPAVNSGVGDGSDPGTPADGSGGGVGPAPPADAPPADGTP